MENNSFVNKVEQSGIITIDLIDFAPKEKSVFLDIKEFLYQGLIVKEKEFKEQVSNTDWNKYKDKVVAVGCSENVIIPTWVFMMLASRLEEIDCRYDFNSTEALDIMLWKENIEQANFDDLAGKKVVIRARTGIAPILYMKITEKLKPIVKTLMYGEAGMPKVIYKNK
ncbi:DUF2480 family protein [Chondrinema litorale]|uniref:DUF2480 family protein n=1 Tax=Chondrinema litorale TaxID=2994555 RepID=UPI0025431F79|nr:DUF2480 family protein [Chondrinema litorale]UZR96848.1 DUF2480 family protein [Chondrinema litorale]